MSDVEDIDLEVTLVEPGHLSIRHPDGLTPGRLREAARRMYAMSDAMLRPVPADDPDVFNMIAYGTLEGADRI